MHEVIILKKPNTDKMLFIILFLTICVVIFSQIGLVFPKTRNVFTNSDLYEGTLLKGNEIPSGNVVLKYLGEKPAENLEIFVNGEKLSLFDKVEKEIKITHTSVIEVYASNLQKYSEIEIKSMSDNVKNTTGLSKVKINEGFNIIGRFLIDN